MEKIKIAILGMGTVGRGLYDSLIINRDRILNILGKEIEVKKVLVRDLNKDRGIPREILTNDANEIINDDEIKIVVELMGGISPAYEYYKKILNNKKHIVTANKALIATHGEELERLAEENGVQLKYEGSVGGGIPIINTLMENLVGNEITEIIGIINGTTNFILTQMTDYGMDFEDALKLAQERGYAEANPTSDLEGEDSAFKLAILSSIAFGKRVNPFDIPRGGIRGISQEDIKYANELGYKIKLLAIGRKTEDYIELQVQPSLIPNEHPLTLVKNEFNALLVKGNIVGDIMLYGKGAGSYPTGSAVLGDLLSICRSLDRIEKHIFSRIETDLRIVKYNGSSSYYIRIEVIDRPGVLGKIAEAFGKYGVSLQSVVQRGRGKEDVPLVFITHETDRAKLDKALEEIKSFDFIKEIANILKVINI